MKAKRYKCKVCGKEFREDKIALDMCIVCMGVALIRLEQQNHHLVSAMRDADSAIRNMLTQRFQNAQNI